MQPAVQWEAGAIVVVDQTALPCTLRTARLETVSDVVAAIARMVVRGAPTLAVVGAFGVVLAARERSTNGEIDDDMLAADAGRLIAVRPTAVNLRWGVERVVARHEEGVEAMLEEASALLSESHDKNRSAAVRAARLLSDLTPARPLRVLTHCNSGPLATAGWGTALGAIRCLHEQVAVAEVLVNETRPLLQGARLTTYELASFGIPHRLCVDTAGMAAIGRGMVDCVVVGADRISACGDVANKIGTYGLALAAQRAQIPFVVVAPEATLDAVLEDGDEIEIEERDGSEVREIAGVPVAPADTPTFNPAFDITPAELVTAIATEQRLIEPAGHSLRIR